MQSILCERGERLTVLGNADDPRIPEGSACIEVQRTPGGTWVRYALTPVEVEKLVKLLRRRGLAPVLPDGRPDNGVGGAIVARGRGRWS
jgi:hypothetical protein